MTAASSIYAGQPCIGIDLGTTYSCVAVWKNGACEIIANDQGNRTTPSYVAFTDTERLVGEAAKNQAARNPTNTVFDAKRLIGRAYDDTHVRTDCKAWPFVVVDCKGKPKVSVCPHGPETPALELSAEEVSAMILVRMKETAEAFLGEPVRNAVITVPAYFNDQQRQATKDAGAIAGLHVMRIINEPTAAAIAYGMMTGSTVEKNVLIFDLGGGTFDVSLLTIDEGVFEVQATAGDTHLGGEDFDQALLTYFCTEFTRKHKVDLRENPRAMRRLRTACEQAKRTLSSSTKATVEVDSVLDGIDFSSTITRAKFEDLCRVYFQSTLKPVEDVLREAGKAKSEIDEVVLVGGSTRIPKIQELLSEFFNKKELCRGVNPDEAVAMGAAIQANILKGDKDSATTDILLIDVAPLSLGIETSGQMMTKIIERNSAIPCKKTQTFSTFADNQPAVTIRVFEGERAETKHNNLLGDFTLGGIPPAARGVPQIEVTFDLDANGILNVSAEDKQTKTRNNITIANDGTRLSKADIEAMIQTAADLATEDQECRDRFEERSRLETLLLQIKGMLTDGKVPEDDRTALQAVVDETDRWMNSDCEDNRYSTAVFTQKISEVSAVWDPVVTKISTDGTAAEGAVPGGDTEGAVPIEDID